MGFSRIDHLFWISPISATPHINPCAQRCSSAEILQLRRARCPAELWKNGKRQQRKTGVETQRPGMGKCEWSMVGLWNSYQQTLRVVEYLFLSLFWHFLSFGFAFVCHFCFALSFFCHLVLHFFVIFLSFGFAFFCHYFSHFLVVFSSGAGG